jgi:mono/diheme cytochrome c family protein
MKSKLLLTACVLTLIAACKSKTPERVVTPAGDIVVIKTLSANEIQGKELFTVNCGKCHKLFAPTAYTNEEWKPILARMQKKARLDDEQMAMISEYIAGQNDATK